LIQIEDETEMLVDLTTSTKRTRNSSNEDEMLRPQTGANDQNQARLGLEEEVSDSMGDDYDVTSQDWDLSRALKKTIRTTESKKKRTAKRTLTGRKITR
jgi:hypothetical protein